MSIYLTSCVVLHRITCLCTHDPTCLLHVMMCLVNLSSYAFLLVIIGDQNLCPSLAELVILYNNCLWSYEILLVILCIKTCVRCMCQAIGLDNPIISCFFACDPKRVFSCDPMNAPDTCVFAWDHTFFFLCHQHRPLWCGFGGGWRVTRLWLNVGATPPTTRVTTVTPRGGRTWCHSLFEVEGVHDHPMVVGWISQSTCVRTHY